MTTQSGFGILALTAASLVLIPGVLADSPPGANYVGGNSCLDCHEEQALPPTQVHARIRPFEVRGHVLGCEGCHGPGSTHLDEVTPESIGRFGTDGLGDQACLSCHQTKGLPEWHTSTHAAEDVGCVDCHSIHTPSAPLDSCLGCHGDVVAQFQLPSHHPLREGKMDCADCHDPHNGQEANLRTGQRLNDLCFDCHQDKEGPFIFEHEPVQEDCSTCHVAHGAVADHLLVANEPALCMQCHEPHFHAGYRASDDEEVEVGGTEHHNPFGSRGMNIAFTTSCTQCHSAVHGTDLPSQAVPSGGRGLTQ